MSDIFINYRTGDEPFAAVLIDQALAVRFGPDRVFRDSRTIRPGAHFPPEIWAALQECRVLIAVIGLRWSDADDSGRRRIDDPDDYVRRELAEALRRKIKVIPVLVSDAALPPAGTLPSDIATLSEQQYLHLRVRNAEYDVMRLTDELLTMVSDDMRPEAEHPAGQSVVNTFHETVHARGAVFGIVNKRK